MAKLVDIQARRMALNVIRVALGTENRSIVLGVVVALVTLGWFGDALEAIFYGQFDLCSPGYWVTLVAFPIVLALYWQLGRRLPELTVDIEQDDNPPQSRALIMFLSPIGEDRTWLTAQETRGVITETSYRERFKKSWRMPVEAIAYHLGRLDKIVIIPSIDAPGKNDGTHHDAELFKTTIRSALPADKRLAIEIVEPADFEGAKELADRLHEVFTQLVAAGYKEDEIIVDITGGQKVPAAAGTVVALGKDRSIQYVSTRDYKVRSYNITYRGDPTYGS